MLYKSVCPLLLVITLAISSRVIGDPGSTQEGRHGALNSILQAERDGAEADRADRLKSLLRTSPDFAPARWQSGDLKVGGTWMPFDRARDGWSNDDTLIEYRRQRAGAARTVDGHWDLAEWCRKHGLDEQRRAHLTAVLDIDPDHDRARKALGFTRVGPFWQSKQEQTRRKQDAQRIQRNLKRWQPRIERICRDLMSTKIQQKSAAMKRLEDISDPSAIPALEWGIAQNGPAMANLVIDRLGHITHTEATMALARQAVFSQWKSARALAAEKLKTRNFEHFVPAVLAVVPTPIRSRRFLYVDGDGSLLYQHVLYQESTNRRLLASSTHRHKRIALLHLGNGPGAFTPTQSQKIGFDLQDQRILSGNFYYRGIPAGAARVTARASANRAIKDRAVFEARNAASDTARRSQYFVDDANRPLEQMNLAVDHLLATITGSTSGHPLEAWWRWWDMYSDATLYSQSAQKILTRRCQETCTWKSLPLYDSCSCFGAGTPVWTEQGFVSIEDVQVGDRVLAKDVETGELKYKPVLKTTVRMSPNPLLKLDLGTRTVKLTNGHPLWISGKGWTKARDIDDGMPLHDLHGTTSARLAGTVPPEKVYNLIVADFHTYFVGEALILSHDTTPNEPTNALVPGLVER